MAKPTKNVGLSNLRTILMAGMATLSLAVGSPTPPAEAGITNKTVTLTTKFGGVDSCHRSKRQKSEARKKVNSFLKKRDYPAHARNFKIIETSYERSQDSWTRVRECKGMVKVKLDYYTVSKDFLICNRTNFDLPFSFRWSGESISKSIAANQCLRYSNWHPDTSIQFDGSLRRGEQTVTYRLGDNWKYNFRQDGRNAIELYHFQ